MVLKTVKKIVKENLASIKLIILFALSIGITLFFLSLDYSLIKFNFDFIHLIAFTLLFFLFNFSRALSMMFFFNAYDHNLSTKKALELHFSSTFAEIASFTGKIGSDAAKFLWLEKKEKRLRSVIGFRILSTYAYGLYLIIFFGIITNEIRLIWLTLFLIFFTSIIILLGLKLSIQQLTQIIISFILFTVSITSTLLVIVVILDGLKITNPFELQPLFSYFYSQLLGILSLLPYGLGVQEIFLINEFNQYFIPEQIAAIIILSRLTTIAPAIIIGWIIVIQKMIIKKNQ